MRQPYRLVVRFLVIGLLLSLITYQWGDALVEGLIPLYQWMVKQLDYRFDTVLFSMMTQHGGQFLLLETTLSQPFMAGVQMISPQVAIPSAASMPLGNVLLPVVLIFTIILAWPITKNDSATHIYIMREYVTRIVLAAPLCILIMLLDMPTQLLKIVWESLNKLLGLNISHDLVYFSYWSDFLNGGGLMAISIATGLVVVGLSNKLLKSTKY